MKNSSGLFFLLITFLCSTMGLAQTHVIRGTVSDSTGKEKLFGATIIVYKAGDTIAVNGGTTDTLGKFAIGNIVDGKYKVKIMYPGYAQEKRFAMVTGTDLDLGLILLKNTGVVLTETVIREIQTRVIQNGDTTTFNANAFKTNPDATAEDLLLKMPGFTSDGSGTKIHGDDVKQVMVDGKPYFGDDPNAALKNIPADMVDQIQVYDGASDQSRFTGFDDGKGQKTVNIITKKNAMNGSFGKVYAGYGTDDRYNAGLSMNQFHGARRFTILGMSNNINQQNFSSQDLFGSGAPGGGGGPRMMKGGPGGPGRGGNNNFMVSQSGGISTTHALGLNYSDEWGPKIKVSGSYFFNYSENINSSDLRRDYFTTNDSSLIYTDTSLATTRNVNHRFNFKFEYAIDSMNALTIVPKFTTQFTDYSKMDSGLNLLAESVQQSVTSTMNSSENLGYTFSNSITYRHRFVKPGRTITFDLSNSSGTIHGSGTYYSKNIYSPADTLIADQTSSGVAPTSSYGATISWTEPLAKKGQLLFTINPSIASKKMNKHSYDLNSSTNDHDLIDSLLSSEYSNIYQYAKGGISYRYNGDKVQLTFGSDYQYSNLYGTSNFPFADTVDNYYNSILPNAQVNYKFSKNTNWKVTYRTNNSAPSLSQLQNVIDNSNPLQLKIGNPQLAQTYEHTLMSHFGSTNPVTSRGFFCFFYGTLTSNYIANSTLIAAADTTINTVFLNKGSQLTIPVNLNGYKSGRMFINYTLPLTRLKMNLGFNTSAGYTRTPGLLNTTLNLADNLSFGPGITLSSNISQSVDFTLLYNGNYNRITNSFSTQSNTSYFTHTAGIRMNLTFWKRLVVNSSIDQTFYNGLGAGYNSNFLLWNAYVGYKFFKNKSLEAKLSAFDILKQNTSIARTTTESYIEDSHTNVLQQYFMFTLTWNIKKFKNPQMNTPGQQNSTPPPPPAH